MTDTQYKFYKGTLANNSLPAAQQAKVENGGIVLSVDDKDSPTFGRMYFRNPFGTAYDKDGAFIEVGTNVSHVDVKGALSVDDGAIISGFTEINCPNTSALGVNGDSEFTGNIIVYDNPVTITNNDQTVSINYNVISFTNQSNNASATISTQGPININATDAVFSGSVIVNTRVNTDNIYPKTTDGTISLNSAVDISDGLTVGADSTVTGISTVGTRVSIGDEVAPAVDYQGTNVFASGVHVWHNSSSSSGAYGVSIVGATDASGGGVYPQIRVYDGTSNNVCSIDMNGRYGNITASGNIESNTMSTNRITAVSGSSVVRLEMPDTVFGSYSGANTQINDGVINTNRVVYCPGIIPPSTASYSIGSPTMSWYQIFLDRRMVHTITGSSGSIYWTAGLGLYDAKVTCHSGSNVTHYLCRMNIPYDNEEYETPIGTSGFLKYKLSNNSLSVSATHSSASVDSIEIISYGVKLVN